MGSDGETAMEMGISQALFPSQLCCSPWAAVTLPLVAPFLALWLMYNLFCQDPASKTSSKFPPLPQIDCLLGSLGKCILELPQTEEDLIPRSLWAGTLNLCVALTKKTPHGCAIPITSSITTRAVFKELGPCWALQAAKHHLWALGVLWEEGMGWALREWGWEQPVSCIPPFPAPSTEPCGLWCSWPSSEAELEVPRPCQDPPVSTGSPNLWKQMHRVFLDFWFGDRWIFNMPYDTTNLHTFFRLLTSSALLESHLGHCATISNAL